MSRRGFLLIVGTLRRQRLGSHVDLSTLWGPIFPFGPSEGRGYVATLISPHHAELEKVGFMLPF